MRPIRASLAAVGLLALTSAASAHLNTSLSNQYVLNDISVFEDRPPECPKCPSCFNCNTESDKCTQFATCSKANGKCVCPHGFGGDDCSYPLCGSLAHGDNREPPKEGEKCGCEEGWTGINCNVCENDRACNALMPPDDDGIRSGGVCYKHAMVVKQNYQMCNVVNQPILDQLDGQIPQVTFSCDAADETCNFQFWVDQRESFYCALDSCSWESEATEKRNKTSYRCKEARCSCIEGRMLCGEEGSINIGEFLEGQIRGPATFTSVVTEGGSKEDGSKFREPAMNELISSVFGDESIFLQCDPGECLYRTEVPGYEKPVARINTPLIAGVIAGCALFIVAVTLFIWYLSRRKAPKHGPIYLDDPDDEGARLLSEGHRSAALQFDNVSYNLNGKQILERVQGIARPGQITAIMGASGAGKTTFLDILARKNKRGTIIGNFYVNGERVPDADFKSVTGFVDQEDKMLPTLTVHETISDSAYLRLPKDMSSGAKEQRIMAVEKQLGIYHIRNQLIGSEEGKGRGVSGGERRRVAIACELVTSPSILFLDEPTSGLDAFNAFTVIECLLNLSRNYNRTVLFTIHQPRSNIVALFDSLILLAKGRTVYSGPFSGCQDYFDKIGFTCPPGFNIADYLVDLTMHASSNQIAPASNGYGPTEPVLDGLRSLGSSIRAIKSIPSASNISAAPSTQIASSLDESSTPSRRPKGSRRESIKQKQDRKLYTRNQSGMSSTADDNSKVPATPKSDDEGPDLNDANAVNQHWLKLNRTQGAPPPQIFDDPDHLPPPPSDLGSDLESLVTNYENSEISSNIANEIMEAVHDATAANGASNGSAAATESENDQTAAPTSKAPVLKGYKRVGYLRQFIILSARTWKNLYRNPMLMLSHYAISILVAVLSGYLYYGLSGDIKGFQNRLGLLFFILALLGFGSLTSLPAFANERLLFMRERANGYYSPVTYFASKLIFDIVPLRLIPPIILAVIVYPMTGLTPAWPEFLTFVLTLVLFNLAAAVICLFIGIVCRDNSVANLVGSLVMLFSLLFAGFLLNYEAMPTFARWLQQLSIFHYGFEALIVNEVAKKRLIDHKYGLDIEVPGATILSTFGFKPLNLWVDVAGLGILSAVMIIIAYGAMHVLLVERR